MKNLFLLALLAISVSFYGQTEKKYSKAYYTDVEVEDFDVDEPVRNTAQLLAVLSSDRCLLTLALKDYYLTSIKEEDLRTPNSMSYTYKVGNAEALDDDYIKLKCGKDLFLRWEKIKKHNYNFLNKIK